MQVAVRHEQFRLLLLDESQKLLDRLRLAAVEHHPLWAVSENLQESTNLCGELLGLRRVEVGDDRNLLEGQLRWQKESGFNRRNLVETAMYRYKTNIGGRLRARSLPNQRTETKVACSILNRMTELGMPDSYRAA